MKVEDLVKAYKGRTLDPLEGSLLGYSVVFLGRERKLAKVYESGDRELSYNISILANRSNEVTMIEIHRIRWGDGRGTEVAEEELVPDAIRDQVERDLLKLIKE